MSVVFVTALSLSPFSLPHFGIVACLDECFIFKKTRFSHCKCAFKWLNLQLFFFLRRAVPLSKFEFSIPHRKEHKLAKSC